MAGNKKKKNKGKKEKRPFSRIGGSLFPRAMLTAVPRSPEPPSEPPAVKTTSALSSALLNATLVGRIIGTPSPNNTMRSERDSPSPNPHPREGAIENSSMARSSMYDYEGSDEEDDDDGHVEEEPRYASVPLRNQRNTISNRPRMDSPLESEVDSTDEEVDVSVRDYPLSNMDVHDGNIKRASASPRETATVKRNPLQKAADIAHYAEPRKPSPVQEQARNRTNSQGSTGSDLTEVTSPVDDFSDLITPPPPWKKKSDIRKEPKAVLRAAKLPVSEKIEKAAVQEEMISVSTSQPLKSPNSPKQHNILQQSAPVAAPRPASQDSLYYDQLERLASARSLQDQELLKKTTERLEQELQQVQKEREQLLETLQIQNRQIQEERSIRKRTSSPQMSEYTTKLERMEEMCSQLRDENSSIRIANDHLLEENRGLKQSINTPRDNNGVFMEELKEQAEGVMQENKELKNVIHKLNIHLSRYQAKYTPPQKGDPPGLPSRGSPPSWITDTKYLSPLIVAYENTLEEKSRLLERCDSDLEQLKKTASEVVRENQRLHRKLGEIQGAGGGVITPAEWQRIQQQAQLVLEENQVILEQLEVQHEKLRSTQKNHNNEITRLKTRLASSESERNALEDQISSLQTKYDSLREQHDKVVVESNQRIPIHEHLGAINEYKRSIEEDKRQHSTELENTMSQLKSVQSEKQKLAIQLTDIQAENLQLNTEIRELKKTQKKNQQKLLLLQQDLNAAEAREHQANEHLNQVLKVAEKTAVERDAYSKMAKNQAQEKEKTVNKLLEGTVSLGKMEEKLKLYKLRANEKLETLSLQLQSQDNNHASQLREYERQISHLQLLLKEKQQSLDDMAHRKREVEEQLETIWQSASMDNKKMNALLNHSMQSAKVRGQQNGAFSSDSDNKGLILSDSDA